MKTRSKASLFFLFTALAAAPVAMAENVPQTDRKIAPNSAEIMAKARAANLRANQPMSKLSTEKAKPYTIISRSGKGQKPGFLWIHAPTVSSHAERTHTLLKAAEDFYADNPVSPIHLYMPILAHNTESMPQATGTYNAEGRSWRVFAYDGPLIPEWRLNVTQSWYELIDNTGKLTIPESEAKDKIGRFYNIAPSHVEPLPLLTLTPYLP